MSDPTGRKRLPGASGVALAVAAGLVSAASILAACGGGPGVPTPDEVPSGAVAVVGERPITRGEFQRAVEARRTGRSPLSGGAPAAGVLDPPRFRRCVAGKRSQPAGQKEKKSAPSRSDLVDACRAEYEALELSVLTGLIEQQWTIQSAREKGVEVSPAELDSLLDQYRAGPGGFNRRLRQSGLRLEDIRTELEAGAARQKEFELRVDEADEPSEEDARTFYEENPGAFGKPETRTVEVLATDSRDFAEDARSLATEGRSLASASRKARAEDGVGSAQEDLTVTQGGASPLPESVEEAVFSASRNVLTGPVEGNESWYLFKVTGIGKGSVPPFEEVEEQALAQARSVEVQRLQTEALDQLRRDWRPKTLCAEQYLVPQCSNGPELPDLPSPDSP